MKRFPKVLLLVHPQMRPDLRKPKGATESDVWRSLKRLGCQVQIEGLQNDLPGFGKTLDSFQPDVVFNLLEEFRDEGVFDFHAISYLEARGIPYTGCNPRGLIVSRNKSWAAQIAAGSGIRAPVVYSSAVQTKFPAFVKFVREHASRGLTERNRVSSKSELASVQRSMKKKFGGELVIQEFISGEDVTVSVLGNDQLITLPPWRLSMGDAEAFATERIKFSAKSRRARGVRAYRYKQSNVEELKRMAEALYKAFDLSGYARLDFRVTAQGVAYFIDVNANPNLAKDEDFACAARSVGLSYEELIRKTLDLARQYKPKL